MESANEQFQFENIKITKYDPQVQIVDLQQERRAERGSICLLLFGLTLILLFFMLLKPHFFQNIF